MATARTTTATANTRPELLTGIDAILRRMKKPLDFRRFVLAAAFVLAFAPMFRAQAPQTGPAAPPAGNSTGKPISLEDYPRFKRMAGASISTDGKWWF